MRILSTHYDASGFLSVRITHYRKEYKLPTFHKHGIPHVTFKGKEKALKDIPTDSYYYTTYGGL